MMTKKPNQPDNKSNYCPMQFMYVTPYRILKSLCKWYRQSCIDNTLDTVVPVQDICKNIQVRLANGDIVPVNDADVIGCLNKLYSERLVQAYIQSSVVTGVQTVDCIQDEKYERLVPLMYDSDYTNWCKIKGVPMKVIAWGLTSEGGRTVMLLQGSTSNLEDELGRKVLTVIRKFTDSHIYPETKDIVEQLSAYPQQQVRRTIEALFIGELLYRRLHLQITLTGVDHVYGNPHVRWTYKMLDEIGLEDVLDIPEAGWQLSEQGIKVLELTY